MTYSQFANKVKGQLQIIYEESEARAIQKCLFQGLANNSAVKMLQMADEEVETAFIDKVNSSLSRLMQFEPVQYVLGKAWFLEMEFVVTPDVLIPRPETEELVELIKTIPDSSNSINVLDIGTGSGIIPISLAKFFKNSTISACDISRKALSVANLNAQKHDVSINFFELDILNYKSQLINNQIIRQHFDIILSNPPYVKVSEIALMKDNVIKYEPHIALFVEDNDPLLFYDAITNFALDYLNDKGYLFFELNESEAENIKSNLEKRSFKEVTIYQDFRNKPRFLSARISK